MKILLINKFHYPRDGVTTHYFSLAQILEAHGHTVAFFAANHPDTTPNPWQKYFPRYLDLNGSYGLFEKLRLFFTVIYNREAKKKLAALVKEFKPDIAHLHNISYHLTPSIIDALQESGVPIVMTLHDFQMISPNYNLFLRGKVWEGTKPHRYWRCITDRCVKDSYAKSAAAAAEAATSYLRETPKKIDLFIAPSSFIKNKFIEYGFPGRIEVLPNPVPALYRNAPEVKEPASNTGGYFLYYGRLSPEKGISVLLKAVARVKDARLKLCGAGPEEKALKSEAARLGIEKRVKFLGFRQGDELRTIISAARAVVVPSVWYENFPYTVIESMALGKTVIASAIGGIPEIIEDGKTGLLFPAGDSEALQRTLRDLTDERMIALGAAARKRARKLTAERFYADLMKLYQETRVNKSKRYRQVKSKVV